MADGHDPEPPPQDGPVAAVICTGIVCITVLIAWTLWLVLG